VLDIVLVHGLRYECSTSITENLFDFRQLAKVQWTFASISSGFSPIIGESLIGEVPDSPFLIGLDRQTHIHFSNVRPFLSEKGIKSISRAWIFKQIILWKLYCQMFFEIIPVIYFIRWFFSLKINIWIFIKHMYE